MRLMRVMFMKDVRRLWPVAAVTSLMLAILANADRWRSDWTVSPMEGWMNLLLTGAWACLAALAVLEDPLLGDRHLWMTRPHRWPALLGAKLAFAVLTIHMPGLLADALILNARGFSPVLYLGELLTKQLLFFAGVIFPAMAVAALLRNFTQFVIVLFSITALLAVLGDGLNRPMDFSGASHDLRHGMVRVLLVVSAVIVVCLQYARRSGISARIGGMVGGLAAAAVFAYLPLKAEYAVRGTGGHISLRSATPDATMLSMAQGWQRPSVFLPIAVAPGVQGNRFYIPFVEVEVIAPDGARLRSTRPTQRQSWEKISLLAHLYRPTFEAQPEWLALIFSPPAWQQFKDAHVRIRGTAGLQLYRLGETKVLASDGSADIPGVGRCTGAVVGDVISRSLLKVFCESPRTIPVTSITLRHRDSGGVWQTGLNRAARILSSPNRTWLSPLHRAQAFFHLARTPGTASDSKWLVPESYLPSAHIEITPEIDAGRALTRFEFADVKLSSPVAPPNP